jgi:hypothetical protein
MNGTCGNCGREGEGHIAGNDVIVKALRERLGR